MVPGGIRGGLARMQAHATASGKAKEAASSMPEVTGADLQAEVAAVLAWVNDTLVGIIVTYV